VSARAGQRTILVDCDLRKPRIHGAFGFDNALGFTSLLIDELPLTAVAKRLDEFSNLVVIPSGPIPPDPSELLAGPSTVAVLGKLAGMADLVVLDSAPVLPVTDAVVLSGAVDGVILVASAETADRRQVARAVDRLEAVEANVLGTVLNGAVSRNTDLYRYGYGYTSEATGDRDPVQRPQSDEPSEVALPSVPLFPGDPADEGSGEVR
jgi:succinoglycan biosynthesis transport protein ExoP